MGTPQFSLPVLNALIEHGHNVVAVYSQPARRAGRRGMELTPTPVSKRARELNIPLFTPTSLKDGEQQQNFAALQLDVAIVVAYGLLLPEPILTAPKFGCYNAHASLLPRWRGAAPIQRAIIAGDCQTGMTIMKMDQGLDTGPVALEQTCLIEPTMTAGQLSQKLAEMAATMMIDAIGFLEKGQLSLKPQPSFGITYADKITKAETKIDWSQSARQIQKMVCGLSPEPGAWCLMDIGGKIERVKILLANAVAIESHLDKIDPVNLIVRCGEGAIALTKLQRSGGKILNARDFARGAKINALF